MLIARHFPAVGLEVIFILFFLKERNNYFFVNRKNILYTLSTFPKIVRQSTDHTASLSRAAPYLRCSTYSSKLTGIICERAHRCVFALNAHLICLPPVR